MDSGGWKERKADARCPGCRCKKSLGTCWASSPLLWVLWWLRAVQREAGRTPGRKRGDLKQNSKSRDLSRDSGHHLPRFLKHFASAECSVTREPAAAPVTLWPFLEIKGPTSAHNRALRAWKGLPGRQENSNPAGTMMPCRPATSKAPTFGVSHKSSSRRGGKAATAGAELFTAAHRRQGARGRDGGEEREHHSFQCTNLGGCWWLRNIGGG